jgi:hypothetical protein
MVRILCRNGAFLEELQFVYECLEPRVDLPFICSVRENERGHCYGVCDVHSAILGGTNLYEKNFECDKIIVRRNRGGRARTQISVIKLNLQCKFFNKTCKKSHEIIILHISIGSHLFGVHHSFILPQLLNFFTFDSRLLLFNLLFFVFVHSLHLLSLQSILMHCLVVRELFLHRFLNFLQHHPVLGHVLHEKL